MTADELEAGTRLRPLPRRRRRRHPLPHLSRHAPDARRLLHPRHLARPLCPLHRGGRASTSTTCSGCCASSRPPRRWCRAPVPQAARPADALRRDLLRLDRAGDATRRWPRSRRRASTSTRCACAPSRSTTRCSTSSPPTTRCSWSSRTATRQLRTLLVNEGGDRPGAAGPGAALRRHADHRALHRRRDRGAAGRAQRRCRPREAAE